MEKLKMYSKPVIRISEHKLKRMKSKKRKLKSYLELALSEDSLFNKKKQKVKIEGTGTPSVIINAGDQSTLLDNVKALRSQLRELRQQHEKEAELYLTSTGIRAKIFGDQPAESCIFLEDIQHLILLASLRIYSPVKPRWCRLLRTSKVSHILVLSVDNLSSQDFLHHKQQFVHSRQTFADIVEIVPPSSFHTDISVFPTTLNYCKTPESKDLVLPTSQPLKNLLPKVVETSSNLAIETTKSTKDVFPRTQLLLSVVQMMQEDYPLPVHSGKDTSNYSWSLSGYKDVADSSPIFAVDCEMCLTDQNKHELTRISIVNENHQVCLDTLVKPQNKIINYLTRYSGITEHMLINVTTTLEDVKEKIRTILPPDAILCGQSLNFDLHALQMFHPYVIDTSVIFNLSGLRHRKSSLKHLSSVFLHENIQNSSNGHCSVEDSMATLKLVQMKLQNGLHFGDTILDGNDLCKQQLNDQSQSLFSMLLAHQKDVCVIGSSASLDLYSVKFLPNGVKRFVTENNQDIVNCTLQEAINHNVTFSHLEFGDIELRHKVEFIDNSVNTLYKACAINALIVVVFTGNSDGNGNGFCMVRIKNSL